MTTRIDEIEDQIFRIHTPVPEMPGGFSFNQYLIVDDDPVLFHTGPRALSGVVAAAIAKVMPIERLRWISFSHVESDECGGLNNLLALAPKAAPLCGTIAAMVSIGDLADRAPRALGDGEVIVTGRRRLQWLDAPHVPHGWECGFLFDQTSRTLMCGDLFTQPGAEAPPVVEGDILGPSEAFRQQMDYWAHAPTTGATLRRFAALEPRTLACMHGSAWRGEGGRLIEELARVLA
jgi:flavorubredoxin